MTVFRAVTIVFTCWVSCLPLQAQTFDQKTQPIVTLTDAEQIDMVLNTLLVLPMGPVTHIEVIDVTGDGFGSHDVLVLWPGEEIHALGAVPPMRLREMMADWGTNVDYREELALGQESSLVVEAHEGENPSEAIAGACIEAVAAHYGGDELQLQVSRSQGKVSVEMWNYDPLALRYGGATSGTACVVQKQRFERMQAHVITVFADGEDCIETWVEDGQVVRQPCVD